MSHCKNERLINIFTTICQNILYFNINLTNNIKDQILKIIVTSKHVFNKVKTYFNVCLIKETS